MIHHKTQRLVVLSLLLATTAIATAGGKQEQTATTTQKTGVIASTSWTAAFADIAGITPDAIVAPATLTHPPEYEITVSDLQNVATSTWFIYAGYERMMETLANAVETTQLIKIVTDNSIATVEQESAKLAAVFGTQTENSARIAEYKNTIANGKLAIKEKGITGARALVHKMQLPLARDLGLTIVGTFGPGPVTAAQIADARDSGYDIIIDNEHNPVAAPLCSAAPNAQSIMWRNFPRTVTRGALTETVAENIHLLINAF